MNWYKLFLLYLCILLLISCTACGTAYKFFQIDIEDKAELYEISAVNAAISRNNEIIWDGQSGQYAGNDSLYCIGSISKSFVAVLALILEDEGGISLDDKVSTYLPDLNLGNKETVTLRDLFMMRSGIADYTDGFDTEDYFKEYSDQSLIDIGISNSVFLQQGEFIYSNTNILIAQQVLEKVTGKSCKALIREKILFPLGLNNTFFAEDKPEIKDRLVPGFSNTMIEQQVNFTDTTTSWAGLACGMYSTAEDMAKWADALQNAEFLAQTSRQELFDFLPVQNDLDYGLCVMRKNYNGAEIIELQGNVPGYSSVIYLCDGFDIAILCNLSDYSGSNRSYSEEIADSFADSLLEATKSFSD